MPTYNRRTFVPRAIEYFLRQDYPNRELIIIDDGTDAIEDLVPADSTAAIRYKRLEKRISLGAKRNLANTEARGEIIVHWDDDDWMAPHRLRYQVETLLKEQADICGLDKLYFFDPLAKKAWQYVYPQNSKPWVYGGTLCYKKAFWNNNPFPDIKVGEDNRFVWSKRSKKIAALPDNTFYVALVHKGNTSPKRTGHSRWHPYPVEKIQTLLDSDWAFYKPESPAAAGMVPRPRVTRNEQRVEKPTGPVRNIFACLVHENPGCIADLVRNLKYLDPSSQILLYNGGTNTDLFKGVPLEPYETIIIPHPRRLKWGRLHDFALDCMRYSIQNLSFDILTIVDSDQLCVRRNYTGYMAKHLRPGENIGMFGITEERQTYRTRVDPAITADLVELFDNDRQLKAILKRTKIWASEEIILPTFVSLLGYKIKTNPCSYNYVKYRRRYSLNDIKSALNQPDVFWVHPVARKTNNELRKYISGNFDNYNNYNNYKGTPQFKKENNIGDPGDNPGYTFVLPIIRQIKNIEGWLDDDEAELLIHAADDVLKNKTPGAVVVEIGSYCGKATIALGNILKKPGNTCSRLYAVDLFDGKVGAADGRIQQKPPTYEKFMKNITRAGLKDIIQPVIGKSDQVADWQNPIALLLIDGLHDYTNVARDFYHFEEWVIPGGYIAFHDYADYFPGVKTFVNKLLLSRKYRKVSCIKSMIIIEKTVNPKDNALKEKVEVEAEIEQQLTGNRSKHPPVTFTCTTGRRLEYFLASMRNFLDNCKDRKKYIKEYIVVDDNSSAGDREVMQKEFPFIRFIWKKTGERGHCQSMNILFSQVKTDYQLQWEDDWLFKRPDNYITGAFEIMMAEEQIKQVSFDNRFGGIQKRTPSGLFYTGWDFKPDSCPDLKDERFEELFIHGVHSYPGWSLNPGLNDFKALKEQIGKFKDFKKKGVFEINYARRFYLAGFKRVSLARNSVDHIGKISAYTLQRKI
jgi:glycosyltransferase involved in cell wall biosynthesis